MWTKSVYTGDLLAAEYDSDGTRYTYLWGPDRTPLSVTRLKNVAGAVPETFAYHADALGNVVALTGEDGIAVATYEYDPYGRPFLTWMQDLIATRNPLRYRAYYSDAETGMFYLPARYYDPATYRFLSPDPAPPSAGDPLSLNAFVYCLGDPVGLDDPSGADPPGKGIHKPGTKEAAEWNRYLRGVRAISWHGGRAVRNVSGCHGIRQLPMVYDEMSPLTASALVVGVIGGAFALTWLAAGGTLYALGIGTAPTVQKAAEVIGDPSDETAPVQAAANEVLGLGEGQLVGRLSDAQTAACSANPGLQPAYTGHILHKLVSLQLPSGWSYNASCGPDYFNGSVYVELTTQAQLYSHAVKYGFDAAGVGSFNGYPVHYICY